MMLRALRRGVPTTRFASSLSSLSRPIPLTDVESLVMSKDRTLLRVTQGGTVVLASLKARDDGRVGGGGLWVEFKERSFASSSAYRSVSLSRRHDVRAESLMTDEERGVASRIQRLVAVALVGVPAKQRVSVKLTVLAAGREDPEIVAVNAASALLEASGMSTCGPFGAARVAFDASAAAESPLSVCDHLVSGDSMLVVCDGRGHVLSMRGVAARPRSGEEIVEGLRAAQAYVRAYLTDVERKMGANMRRKKSNVMVPGADPAAGRRVREQLEQRIAAHLAAQTGPGSVEGLYHHIESSIKPDVVEGLMRQGRWRHEASRIKGSGCVTAQDLDHTIRGIVQDVLRKRGDGSEEDAVSAPNITLNHVSSLHAGSLYNAAGAIVESAVTVVRGRSVEFPSSVSSVSSLEPSYARGDGDDRVSSVFLTCAHGKPSVLNNNSSYTASSDQLDDIDRAEFLRDAVSRMLPPPETLPFAFRTNSEVLANDARGGIGSVAAAVNGMSAAVAIALLDSLSHQKAARTKHVGRGGNGGRDHDRARARDKAHVMPWTAAAVGISYVYPPGTLDGEEHELAALEPRIEGFNVLRDVGGLGSLVTDAELTVAGPCPDTDDKYHDEASISGWMLQCHAPTRVTPEMVARGIEAAMDVREARRKVLHAATSSQSQDLPVFGELAVSTASMPKLLVDRAASLRKIEDATGGIIHVKAPGLLSLFASSSKAYAELEEHVSAASGAFLVPNRVYRAEVMAVLDFGAFVRLPKCDVEAMLHISEVKDERIGSINDELAVGDLIDVMYLGQDDQGGLRVSKRRVGGEPQTRRRRGG